MRLSLHAALLFAVGTLSHSAATTPDSSDYVLLAYRLSSEQESQFSTTDGQVSAFWDHWDEKYDRIVMRPATHAPEGRDNFTGPEDCSMDVLAAYGTAGLYLSINVTDDSRVEADGGEKDPWKDVVELYVDKQSSADIWAQDPFEVFCYPTWWTLTFTSIQIVVWSWKSPQPESFRYGFYNEAMWEWQDTIVTATEAQTNYDGMSFESLSTAENRGTQEWFIPWTQVGVGGIEGEFQVGQQFAFAGGCHDMDATEGDQIGSLRWRNKVNPFSGAQGTEGFLNPWGDIELAEATAGAVTDAAHPQNTKAPLGANRPEGQASVFTLDGRRTAANGTSNRTRGVRIIRSAADGHSVSPRLTVLCP